MTKPPNTATPEQIARECLAAADNSLVFDQFHQLSTGMNRRDRAIRLAGKRARGAKLRAVVMAIGNALVGASAN
jgi:hypothetical protein